MSIVKWNEDNKYGPTFCDRPSPNLHTDDTSRIRFMRISSELFPFASHAKYGYSLDYAAADLKVRLSPSGESCADPPPRRRQETSLMGMATG